MTTFFCPTQPRSIGIGRKCSAVVDGPKIFELFIFIENFLQIKRLVRDLNDRTLPQRALKWNHSHIQP
jgi:hypothetical protein